jgi:hypothetical protein
MSIEKKIQELLERAKPMAPVQEPVIKQGNSDVDHAGQADVENLGSEHAGAASSANAGAAFPRMGDQSGGEKAPVMQGSSKVGDPTDDEEDLSGEGAGNSPGQAASARAGAATPLPTSKSGGEMAPVMQGSSNTPTPGQNEDDQSWKDELNTVFEEAGLSQDAIEKIVSIFENAVTARLDAEIEAASDTLAETVNELADARNSDLFESVNEFLNYAVEQWMEQNQLAVEQGLRVEIAESFISDLKQVFVEHNIDVPADAYDPLMQANSKIEELESQLNAAVAEKVKLAEEKRTLERHRIVERVSSDMVATDAEKFAKLVEEVEFDNAQSFEEKAVALKSRYFPKGGTSYTPLQEDASEPLNEPTQLIESVVKAISKSAKR